MGRLVAIAIPWHACPRWAPFSRGASASTRPGRRASETLMLSNRISRRARLRAAAVNEDFHTARLEVEHMSPNDPVVSSPDPVQALVEGGAWPTPAPSTRSPLKRTGLRRGTCRCPVVVVICCQGRNRRQPSVPSGVALMCHCCGLRRLSRPPMAVDLMRRQEVGGASHRPAEVPLLVAYVALAWQRAASAVRRARQADRRLDNGLDDPYNELLRRLAERDDAARGALRLIETDRDALRGRPEA